MKIIKIILKFTTEKKVSEFRFCFVSLLFYEGSLKSTATEKEISNFTVFKKHFVFQHNITLIHLIQNFISEVFFSEVGKIFVYG